MDTTETKQLIARHFDYSPHGTGQFFHGEWFTPKHKDSLAYLLEEVHGKSSKGEVEHLRLRLRDAIEELKTIKTDADNVSESVSDLCDELEKDAE